MARTPKTGYDKNNIQVTEKDRKRGYVSKLIHKSNKPTERMTGSERFIKFLIYLGLRLAIRPRKWKNPQKNYEVIDRAYQRFVSADFVYIPSSIAFYIVMAFMPIISLIFFATRIPGISSFLSVENIREVIGKFIPGIGPVLSNLESFNDVNDKTDITALVAMSISLSVTTWIASGGFAKLVFTQSYIYEHKFVGGFWMNRIRGMFLVLALTLGLIFALAVNIAAMNGINNMGLTYGWTQVFKYVFLIVGLFPLIFVGLVVFFKLSPRYKIELKNVVPGAMVATIPIVLFLSFFGVITSFWSYGEYGFIGALMYISMASLMISIFIFVGLIANASYYKTFVSLKMRAKRTLSRK